jgi:glycosyltransferase involved in cell wall biosynthesis
MCTTIRLLGAIPEPPFHPRSWSASSANFFGALRHRDALADAVWVRMPELRDRMHRLRNATLPIDRWRWRYYSDVRRFRALTRAFARDLSSAPRHDAVLQVGAWFSAPEAGARRAFSYHDGNAALWHRLWGRGLVDPRRVESQLAWERRLYHQMDGIFVMSHWLATSFVQDFGVPESKVHVVGAGLNFTTLPSVPMRDFSRPVFLFVGREFERKGGRYLLEAFARVRRSRPDARLVVVGPPARGSADGVEWTGLLSRGDPVQARRLHEFFNTATINVLPSVFEPFGISLVEGMAHGLPCIAVDRCAMPEIVAHGETGLIARAEDADSLANAMLELASDPALAARWGAAGRARCEERFTWHAVTGKIVDIIAQHSSNATPPLRERREPSV